jgi:hypothetical protein
MLAEVINPAILRNVTDKRTVLAAEKEKLELRIEILNTELNGIEKSLCGQGDDVADEILIEHSEDTADRLRSAEVRLRHLDAQLTSLDSCAKFTARTLRSRKLQAI